jgi:TrmH family RNA methyltransferase
MEQISSLHSPHVGRVKALLGSRGKKNRELENTFVVEGIQAVREALLPKMGEGLKVKQLFLTSAGIAKLQIEFDLDALSNVEIFETSEQVMNEMTDSQSPQGILALCSTKSLKIEDLWRIAPSKIAYFWQIQDPGNAGTVIRTADACGFDAVIFSDNSVDIFNPKTVRATVGSLWHLPVIADVEINQFIVEAFAKNFEVHAMTADGENTLNAEYARQCQKNSVWIFGNEARGLPELPDSVKKVQIPMKGHAESLNVASAASILMHLIGVN